MAIKKVTVKSSEVDYFTSEVADAAGDTVKFVDAAGDQNFYVSADNNAILSGNKDDLDVIYIDGNAADYNVKVGSKTNVVILESESHKIEIELPKLIKDLDSQAQLVFRDGSAMLNGTLNTKGKPVITLFGDAAPDVPMNLSKTAQPIDTDLIELDAGFTSEEFFGESTLLSATIEAPTEVYEDDGYLDFEIFLSDYAPSSGLTLNYEFVTAKGNATYGKDYTLVPDEEGYVKPTKGKTTGTITIDPDSDYGMLSLELTDDIRVEDDESIVLRISGKGLSETVEFEVVMFDSDSSAEIVGVQAQSVLF